ncbi:MAG TPA: energy transducer TonB [Allosphingosinicella sp.]|jgi:protein TonB
MAFGAATAQDRIKAAIPAALVHALVAYALIAGLGADMPAAVRERLKLIALLPEPPPEPLDKSVPPPAAVPENERERRAADPREEGASSAANLRSTPTEVVAPEPVVPLPVVPPVVSAPVPGRGSDPTAGAADVRGPGTGSGGFGDGFGSGRGGYGGGGGGGAGLRPPRWIRGRLRNSDYPPGLGEMGVGGTVSVIYAVLPDGSVADCRITRSSGSRILDETTCRLIEQRFRYEPARDRLGRPIRAGIEEDHSWVVEDDPEPPPYERRRRRGWQ